MGAPKPTLGTQIRFALAGLSIMAVLTVISVLILAPALKLSSDSDSEEVRSCHENLKALHSAVEDYARDHGGLIPGANWHEALQKYEPNLVAYACPRQRRIDPRSFGYALNQAVAGKKLAEVPPNEVLFFDSEDVRASAIAAIKEAPTPGRHRNGRFNAVIYVNGLTNLLPPP